MACHHQRRHTINRRCRSFGYKSPIIRKASRCNFLLRTIHRYFDVNTFRQTQTHYIQPPQPTTIHHNTMNDSKDTGVTGAARFVTSSVGNLVGGVARTAGNVTGAAGRGVGDTITGATGSAGKPVGDALGALGSGVENGANDLGKGVERAGEWKK